MQHTYIWLALLLLYMLASIMERFLSVTHTHTHTHKQITILLLRAFKILKLAIIFKIFLLFYLLLNYIIL